MGVNTQQVAEFKKIYPDVPITKMGDVGPFNSYHEHARCMKRLGFHNRGE